MKILKSLYDNLTGVPAVFIDGLLYVMMGVTGVCIAMLASDEAGKYMELRTIFFLKWIVGILDVVVLNLKMFRSNAFAEYTAKKQNTGNTQIFVKQPTDK